MADEQKKIVFSVDIDNDDFLNGAAETRKLLQDLKKQQKELDTSTEQGAKAYEQYEAAIKVTGQELRKLTDLQKTKLQFNKAEEGSNTKLRAALKILTAQYNELSQEQRETTQEGQVLADQISEITAKLKENESAVGDNRRNVGNYKEAIVEAGQELKIATAFTDENRQANLGLRGQMEAAAESASALAGTFALLSTLTKDNEEAQKLLEKIMLAVAAATAIANIAKSKGQILDTISFVKTKALTAAQYGYNLAVGAGTKATKLFRAALVTTGIGAVIVLIGTLIDKLSVFIKKTESAADIQERMNRELEREKDLLDDLAEFREEVATERVRQLERERDLREAQGATEAELKRLEIGIIEERLRAAREMQKQTVVAIGQQDRYYAALIAEKDLVNELKIARIELNEALDEELRIRAELEAQRTTAIKKTKEERVEVETTQSLVLTTGTETDEFFEKLFEKQRKRNKEAIESYNTDEQLAALESLAETAAVVSGQVGDAFAASLTEAGLNLEDFTRRLLVLTIDTLQRKLLVAIAETYFDQIKEKGFAGIVTGSALTALLVGFAESAKAALSKPVKFAQGGEFQPLEVGGKLHSQGGTMYVGEDGNRFEVERGEKIFITNRKASSFIGAIAEINKAFGGKGLTGSSSFLRDGGFAANSVAGEVNGQFRTAQLAADIVRGLPEFVVSVSEIDRGLAKVRTVENVVSI